MKPFMKNWLVGKLSSSFVSEIIRISILSLIWCVSNSNLFLVELIFNVNITVLVCSDKPGAVTGTCNPATLEAEFPNDMGYDTSWE